jgi:hypothetical protein
MLTLNNRWAVVGKIPYVKVTKDLPTDILDVISTSKLHFVKVLVDLYSGGLHVVSSHTHPFKGHPQHAHFVFLYSQMDGMFQETV